MQNSPKPHFVVVGAGILGASIAFHLSLRGVRVTVVDSGQPGQQATRVSFAWLNGYNKDPFHYHDINRRSLEMWSRFLARLKRYPSTPAVDLTWGGDLRLANTQAGADKLIARAEQLQAWGYPNRILTTAEVRALEPRLPAAQLDQLVVAAYSDIDGHVDAGQVVQACVAAAKANGTTFSLGTAVTGIELEELGGGSRVNAIQLGNRRIECDKLVLVGGADMPALAKLAGIDLPLEHTFGATILTQPMAKLFDTVSTLHSAREGDALINLRQFKDGTVMVQSYMPEHIHSEFDGDRGRTDEEIEEIMADAAAFLPALEEAEVKTVNRGRRPIPQDGHPIIGFTQKVSNLYLATTHSGVTLTPLIGEMATIELVDNVTVGLLEPYRVERFEKK